MVDECQELAGEYDYEGANGLVDQEYTITDHPHTYRIDIFVVHPAWCELVYDFKILDDGEEAYGAVDLDPESGIFTFENRTDLSLAG